MYGKRDQRKWIKFIWRERKNGEQLNEKQMGNKWREMEKS